MLNAERIHEIIKELKGRRIVSVRELAKRYYTSESTIRRDLAKLEKMGILRRSYGGALLLEGVNAEIPLSVREHEQKTAKELIARLASHLVKNAEVLFLDSSSTVLHMVMHLKVFEDLTIITNGAKTAMECGNLLKGRIYSTGGLLRENSLSYIGEQARKSVQNYHADILFFSCRALSIEKGLTDVSEEEALLRRSMMENARKLVLLADSQKFGEVSFCSICPLTRIHCVVTDKYPGRDWEDYFSANQVDLIWPKKNPVV
jgi:DeoR/GlpR family transcriptional regulator of sugar metabolism